jgi:hypothetical protein
LIRHANPAALLDGGPIARPMPVDRPAAEGFLKKLLAPFRRS